MKKISTQSKVSQDKEGSRWGVGWGGVGGIGREIRLWEEIGRSAGRLGEQAESAGGLEGQRSSQGLWGACWSLGGLDGIRGACVVCVAVWGNGSSTP